ncbi:MAG: C69 family dipeptidase [Eubacteriales bacterium]
MKRNVVRFFTMVVVFSLIFSMTVTTAMACTTIVVGKDKTADGSVLLAHSEELGDSPQHLVVVPRKTYNPGDLYISYAGAKIPQPAMTYSYIASTIFDKNYYPGDFTTGINEYQVSIANNMSWTRGVSEDAAWETIPGGVFWTEFTQLALERSKTAREAIELMGNLCETYHLSSDPGTMYGVADPNEGWFIEIARDGQWIAQRVPDNGFDMRANSYRIGVVDLESPDILHSPNLVQYAIDKKWYDPTKGPFSFADVYGEPANQADEYNNIRHRIVSEMLTKDGTTPKDLIGILRTAYEGTPSYKANPATGSPFHTDVRTVSRTNTEVTAVAQLRSWLPSEIGGAMWWSFCTSKTSPYVPWYYGTQTFPEAYTKGTMDDKEGSAYWVFDSLRKYVDLNYSRTIGTVSETWSAFEAKEFSNQASLEAEALKLYNESSPSAAAKYLNAYSNAQGEAAYAKAQELLASLKADATKYFNDIGDKNWAIQAINKLHEDKIINGVGNGKFDPDSNVTRADFIVMLVRALDLASTTGTNFGDIPQGAYYNEAVGIAKSLGIASGTSSNQFSPNQFISREDMMTMLSRALSAKNITLKESASDMSAYNDADTINGYAQAAVSLLMANGIVMGSNDSIHPLSLATRAETAVILNRLLMGI